MQGHVNRAILQGRVRYSLNELAYTDRYTENVILLNTVWQLLGEVYP